MNNTFETFYSSIIIIMISLKHENKRQAVSNNSLPCHWSASFNRSFAIELGLLIRALWCYGDARSEYPFYSMHCNVSRFVQCTRAHWRCRCRRHHRIIIVNAVYFVLQLLLFDAHCFRREWRKNSLTHTYIHIELSIILHDLDKFNLRLIFFPLWFR